MDLKAAFPPLNKVTGLETLILRSCNIIGQLPEYLKDMTALKTLLSLNWQHPNWTSTSLDTKSVSTPHELVCTIFDGAITSWYNLSINFGGQEVTVNGSTAYAADTKIGGPSSFFQSSSNWAFSSTGNFMDGHPTDTYIVKNSSVLSMPNPELYMNVRLSPLSLTYYAFCLGNGNYTVNLHFVEIMFTDDKTFSSLGRRIFDVYIQGKLVMKDFDIVKRAGGVAKAVIERFDVVVTDNTMEIRFYWAGKGTTDIPVKGVYGPLIFAISVFIPPSETENSTQNGNSIPVEAVAGIVAAGAFVICLALGIIWWKGCLGRKSAMERGFGLAHWKIYLEAIRAAMNDFDAANKIGEGGFSPVYKGFLSDGTVIAVKQLSSDSRQGNREFLNEIGVISAFQHPHLVKLYGWLDAVLKEISCC
ncbi:hypothetical protein CJ030_MR4G029045 [Morella rubra]|uniref:non-specific serine/threonine protein kinase n=1 Tax=Morella rubra TaxID=262757 RepID=A0A6A1VU33_9ROSI|nr:hypothetical protein CJ030_MR4G029045 [Morella rubra]